MSILSLAELAVARDRTDAGAKVLARPAGGARTPAEPAQPLPAPEQTTADSLTSAIPTETLAVYTGVVGIFTAAANPGVVDGYLPFRWWAFGAFVALTLFAVWAAYHGKRRDGSGRKSSFPALEAATATIAAAVWGLVMPGSPLLLELSGTVRTITVSTLTLTGSALVAALSTYLTKGVAKPG